MQIKPSQIEKAGGRGGLGAPFPDPATLGQEGPRAGGPWLGDVNVYSQAQKTLDRYSRVAFSFHQMFRQISFVFVETFFQNGLKREG